VARRDVLGENVPQLVTPYQHSYILAIKLRCGDRKRKASVRFIKANLRMIPERSTLL
jgi:hypothetical protein